MKVVTWNIGEDERNEKGKLNIDSYNYIINFIKNENVDVICLQEAIIKSNYLPSISQYINEKTDLKYKVEYELSDSHINIGCRMGIVICSKYEINNYETLLLENPNLVYSVDEKTTYYSHDKGFIISNIQGINIVTGHCLPFHVFKRSPLEYLNIFEKADKKFIDIYNANDNLVLCGDFNYDNVSSLFPKIMEKCKDLINEPTRNEKQLDHFIISDKLSCCYNNVADNIFDHKLGIFEIYN